MEESKSQDKTRSKKVEDKLAPPSGVNSNYVIVNTTIPKTHIIKIIQIHPPAFSTQ